MELLGLVVVITALVVLLAQLERTDRRRRAHPLDATTRARLDRDAERVRADLLAAPERLARQPLWRSRSQGLSAAEDWTRRA